MRITIISKLAGLALVALAMVGAGCRSTETVGDHKFRTWEVETFKTAAQSHQNVVLVCIYEEQLRRRALPLKHRLDTKATVVCCYKGAWQLGEPIVFYRELEFVPQDWAPDVGHLVYLLFDEHTHGPVGIDTGDDWAYKPEFERALRKDGIH